MSTIEGRPLENLSQHVPTNNNLPLVGRVALGGACIAVIVLAISAFNGTLRKEADDMPLAVYVPAFIGTIAGTHAVIAAFVVSGAYDKVASVRDRVGSAVFSAIKRLPLVQPTCSMFHAYVIRPISGAYNQVGTYFYSAQSRSQGT
jgi:hypothetical protein